MPLTIPIAHDFICPWCWVGLLQARKLQEELGVRLEWRGYELFPIDLEWPDYPIVNRPLDKPATPSRFELMLAADGIRMPEKAHPHKMRTYNAHQAVEFAKTEGDDVADEFVEALYRAYWQKGEVINDLAVLKKVAQGIVTDIDGMLAAARTRRFRSNIVEFDEEAYSKGVYNVPTFFIGGQKLAEQPYTVLFAAAKQAVEEMGGTSVYNALEFPCAPKNRPYVFINMVSTIDGKIVSGTRDEPVTDLGSDTDHLLMGRIERAADGIMTGARTLRATSPKWHPRAPNRFVVSKSGNLPPNHGFFEQGHAYVVTNGSAMFSTPAGVKVLRAGNQEIDFPLLLERMLSMGVKRLLVTGGSDLNAQLFAAGFVDEIFLTIAPKIKLGADVPTIADGEALPRHALQDYELVEHHAVESELFLRYRRKV